MHVDMMFPSRFLKAADLRGKDAILTIARVANESVETKQGAEKRWILYFAETAAAAARDRTEEKRMIFRVTVARQIAKALGERDAERWVGQRITLYPATCQAYGETVDCIRVRETAPAPVEAE